MYLSKPTGYSSGHRVGVSEALRVHLRINESDDASRHQFDHGDLAAVVGFDLSVRRDFGDASSAASAVIIGTFGFAWPLCPNPVKHGPRSRPS